MDAQCWNLSRRKVAGSFSYRPRAVICLVVRQERNVFYTPGAVIFLVLKRVGSFSYTLRDSSFVGKVRYLTRPVLVSVLG